MPRFDELDRLGDAIGKTYADCVDRLLVNIARHFKYLEPGEEPGGAFQWQAKKLAELGQVNRENVRIIREMLGNVPTELSDGLERAILDALSDIEEPLRQAAEDGLLGDVEVPTEPAPRAMRAFTLYHGQSLDGMDLVNSRMLESTAEAYRGMVADITNRLLAARGAINAATGEVLAGVESFNSALKLATNRLLAEGLTGFVDQGGHHWKPDTYVAMTMRSTYHNVSRAAFWERNEEYGNDLYLVSQHPGARPLCYPWQCKVISRTDQARDVTDGDGNPVHVYAQSETTYGEPAGLFGINCGHHPMLFIPGASKVPALNQTESQNAETYAQSQKQRKLERDFRKARLEYAAARAQGADTPTTKAALDKLHRADDRLNKFEKDTGRRRRREREYGFSSGNPPKVQASEEKARLQTHYSNEVSQTELAKESFAKKFEGITGKPLVDKSIRQSAEEMLKHRGGTDGEDLHLIDGNTGEVIHKLTSSHSDKSIDYRSETLAAIDRAHNEGRYIIAIHNHPNGLPPTLDDGSSAFAHRYDRGVVVGHNLEVWTYGQTRTVIPTSVCELLHNGLSEKLSKEIDFDDELWYDLLRKAGMEVSRR